MTSEERGALLAATLLPAKYLLPLRTVNGCGVMLLGRFDDLELEPFTIRQQFLAVLFIPIIPLRFFLVQELGDGRYEFLGAVPYRTIFRCYPLHRLLKFYGLAFAESALIIALLIAAFWMLAKFF